MSAGRCAVCDFDHRTHRLCDACKRDPANRDWRAPSAKEAGGWDMDDFGAGSSTNALPRRDPYAGPLAIEIMRMYCLGYGVREISRAAKCDVAYASRTISYWETHRQEKLCEIKKVATLASKRKRRC